MADDKPSNDALMRELLDKYLGPKQTNSDPSWHDKYVKPWGSVATAERGPWMRQYMPQSLADFLASALQYGPMALRASSGPLPPRWQSSYHGTGDPNFALQPRPIWSEPSETGSPGPFVSEAFAKNGAVAPLKVNTADYLNVGDTMMGLQTALARRNLSRWDWGSGPAWVNTLADILGKKGVRYQYGPYEFLYSKDPATVRPLNEAPPDLAKDESR